MNQFPSQQTPCSISSHDRHLYHPSVPTLPPSFIPHPTGGPTTLTPPPPQGSPVSPPHLWLIFFPLFCRPRLPFLIFQLQFVTPVLSSSMLATFTTVQHRRTQPPPFFFPSILLLLTLPFFGIPFVFRSPSAFPLFLSWVVMLDPTVCPLVKFLLAYFLPGPIFILLSTSTPLYLPPPRQFFLQSGFFFLPDLFQQAPAPAPFRRPSSPLPPFPPPHRLPVNFDFHVPTAPSSLLLAILRFLSASYEFPPV